MDINSISSLLDSLSDEDMDTIKNLAASLFSGAGEESRPEESHTQKRQEHVDNEPSFTDGIGIDLASIGKIASVVGALSSSDDDGRCRLLYALRPMLKEERRHKVDEAVKMLKIIDLLPKLREQGIL